MYNNVKSMVEKEPPNYKKSFLFSLMAVLLISSLAVCMCTGQAMGQTENDVEPLSMARITGSVIVTIGFMIWIIAIFTRAVNSNTAKINSSNIIKPLPHVIKRLFLWLLTFGLYLPHFYAEWTAKFNAMSRHALKQDHEPLNFPATWCSAFVGGFLSLGIFAFVVMFLNPAVYTALFNLDWTALFVALGEGFNGFMILPESLRAWTVLIFGGMVLCFVSPLFAIARLQKPMARTAIALLVYYRENSNRYYTECDILLNKYANLNIFASPMSLNDEAFKLLIKCHNKEFSTQQTWT